MTTAPAPGARSARRPGRRLLGDLARHTWGASTLLAAAAVLRTTAGLALPAVVAGSVAAAVTRQRTGPAVAAVAGLGLLALAAEAGIVVGGGRVTARGGARLRHRLVDAVLRAGPAGQQRVPAGDATARLTGGVDQAATAVPTVIGAGVGLATGLAAVAVVAHYDPWLALAVAAVVPVLLLLVRGLLRGSTDLFRTYQELQSGIADRLVDALGGARTIRAAGTTEREIERVLAALPVLHRTGRATWLLQRRALWRVAVLVPVAEVVVLTLAGLAVGAGRLPATDLVAVAGYVALALGALGEVDAVTALGQIGAGADRLAELVDAAPVEDPALPAALPPGPGALRLRGVRVGPPDRPLLDGVDLDLPAGAAVALVGAPGAGKSVLAAVVGRLVEADAGEVLLDGTPVRAVRRDAVRREVGYAFERPAALGGSVRGMIGYGVPGRLDRAELAAAAGIAGAAGFVARLPAGYDTPMAGVPLSGGELQRLGLAQAVARRTRVLVLDDATSSLDTITEEEVSRAMTAGPAGRTRLVVARRARTAARADLVVWLDRGRVRAVGTHRELCAEADYRALFEDRASTP